MRKILGFGAVLAASCLAGTAGLAHAQTGAGNQAGSGAAGVSGRVNTTNPSTLITAPNNLEQQANQNATNAVAGTNANATAPGQTAATPPQSVLGTQPANANPVAGTMANPANGTQRTVGNAAQIPGTVANPVNSTQTAVGNAAAGTVNPGTANPLPPGTPGEWNYRSSPAAVNAYAPGVQQGSYPGAATAATPGYTNQVMPGMTGYNSVNPMATTMSPGYYYAGSAGMPYGTYNTPTYSSYGTNGYYNAPRQGYMFQRRGLFGRRNRIAYPASPNASNVYSSYPSGSSTYGTTTYNTPGTYTYGNTTYSTPGTYTYGNRTYGMAPATYSYGTYPY
jgi:hypothetical protein